MVKEHRPEPSLPAPDFLTRGTPLPDDKQSLVDDLFRIRFAEERHWRRPTPIEALCLLITSPLLLAVLPFFLLAEIFIRATRYLEEILW